MRDISVAERRARLGRRHLLARRGDTVERAVDALVALHSSDPTSVYLSTWARVDDFARRDLERALYDDRTVVRMLGMRRTLFVVPVATASSVQRGCTDDVLAAERRRLVPLLERQGIAADGERWLEETAAAALAALHERGEAFTAELTRAVPGLGLKITMAEGTKWATEVALSSRVMFLLATEGRVVRGRPRGTWVSSQYRWAPTIDWLGAPLPAMPPEHARAELARRWLARFGPATAGDLKWWMGWTVAKTRAALAATGAVPVTVGDEGAFVNADDEDPVDDPDSWVALLPGLDATTMGWKQRDWYLGEHGRRLFDRNGNAGPTIWVDGRVVGGWAQLADGSIVTHFLEDVGSDAAAAVATEAGSLEHWLGGTTVTSRFPTPLEKQLSGR
jgi:Winged helix DNA-binding domain